MSPLIMMWLSRRMRIVLSRWSLDLWRLGSQGRLRLAHGVLDRLVVLNDSRLRIRRAIRWWVSRLVRVKALRDQWAGDRGSREGTGATLNRSCNS